MDDDIEGSFERPKQIDVSMAGREYGPTAGIKPLRAAVARLYNEHHRKGKSSQYSWENVAIVPGGRAGLIRIAAVLNVCIVSGLSYLSTIILFYQTLFCERRQLLAPNTFIRDILGQFSRDGPQTQIIRRFCLWYNGR